MGGPACIVALVELRSFVDGEVVGLARYAASIRRRGWLVLAFMLVLAVAAFGYTATRPAVYKATAQVLIRPYSSAQFNEPVFTSEQVATQVEVMQSLSVATPAVAALGLDESPSTLLKSVTATAVGDTSVIAIAVTRQSPELAAEVANAIGDSYLRFRAQNQPPSAKNDSPGRIIDRAQPPHHPAGRSPLKGGILGAVIGFVLGCIAALVLAARNTSVGSDADVAAATAGLPVLARIPRTRTRAGRGVALLDTPESREALAYRFLATTVRVIDDARHKAARADVLPTVVVVASAAPGDGRTTVAANLAVASAATGQRVLVCDADLSNPGLTSLLGLPDEVTLDRVLLGESVVRTERLARPARGLLGLGTREVTGAEPLPMATGLFARMVASLVDVVDVIVVDTSPLLSSAEALELASAADLVLLAVRERSSTTPDIEAALGHLRGIGVDPAGVVVTRSYAYSGSQRSSRRRASSPKAARSVPSPVPAAASTPPTDLSRR